MEMKSYLETSSAINWVATTSRTGVVKTLAAGSCYVWHGGASHRHVSKRLYYFLYLRLGRWPTPNRTPLDLASLGGSVAIRQHTLLLILTAILALTIMKWENRKDA